MIVLASVLFFVFLAGVCDAQQTAIKDYPTKSTMYNYITKHHPEWMDWYLGVGGNDRWNPALPSIPWLGIWFGDGWHTFKIYWIVCWSCAVGTLATALYGIWVGMLCTWVLCYANEGTTFSLFYSMLFRTDKKFDLWKFIKSRNPFINTHKKTL